MNLKISAFASLIGISFFVASNFIIFLEPLDNKFILPFNLLFAFLCISLILGFIGYARIARINKLKLLESLSYAMILIIIIIFVNVLLKFPLSFDFSMFYKTNNTYIFLLSLFLHLILYFISLLSFFLLFFTYTYFLSGLKTIFGGIAELVAIMKLLNFINFFSPIVFLGILHHKPSMFDIFVFLVLTSIIPIVSGVSEAMLFFKASSMYDVEKPKNTTNKKMKKLS